MCTSDWADPGRVHCRWLTWRLRVAYLQYPTRLPTALIRPLPQLQFSALAVRTHTESSTVTLGLYGHRIRVYASTTEDRPAVDR